MDSNRDLVTIKGTVNISELESTVKGELNRDIEVVIPPKKDTTATEKKDTETGATNKKEKDNVFSDKKGREVEASETVRTRKNSEGEGNASVQNKRENKDIRRSSHRMNRESSTSTSSSQETVNDSMRSYPNPYNQRPVDPRYYYGPRYHGYYRPPPPPPPPPTNYSNGLDMFSDENPHSCIIM